MTQSTLKGVSATTHALSGQDFGEPKPKKRAKTIKKPYIPSDPPYIIRCRKCNKANHISPTTITQTKDLICSCGQVVAIYAASDYGDKQRKLIAQQIKAQQDEDPEDLE